MSVKKISRSSGPSSTDSLGRSSLRFSLLSSIRSFMGDQPRLRLLSAVVSIFGILTVFGWQWNIYWLVPSFGIETMKPITAVELFFLGLLGYGLIARNTEKAEHVVAGASWSATFVLFWALSGLASERVGILHFFEDGKVLVPGNMSVGTMLCALFCNAAGFAIGLRIKTRQAVSRVLAVATLVICASAYLGYASGLKLLYFDLPGDKSLGMAPTTTICFTMLAVVFLKARTR